MSGPQRLAEILGSGVKPLGLGVGPKIRDATGRRSREEAKIEHFY
jgi:hypothetical protein